MQEHIEHLDLILNAPKEVSVSYTMSILASRALSRLDEEAKKPAPETPEDKPEKSDALKAVEIEKAKADAKKAEEQGDKADPTLDPEYQKEFYLTSFEYKGKKVILKKVGMGASAPVSAYVNGERKELFLTQGQAEREIKRLIDLNMVSESVVDTIRSFGLQGGIIKHDDGTETKLDFDTASSILEMYDHLNNKHKEAFESNLKLSHEDAIQMIGFFQERLKRDLV
tara:strand:- start:22 stop:699 length:678 start_codon:yes stop_codon:yes gene_type:complete